MLDLFLDLQRIIHATLSGDIAAFARDRNWIALLAVLPLGIVFGGLHAMTPGHSKLILASYVLGSRLAPHRALLTALLLAVTHIGTAVILALVGSALIARTMIGAGEVPALEWTSRLLLVAMAPGWRHAASGNAGMFMGKVPPLAFWPAWCRAP